MRGDFKSSAQHLAACLTRMPPPDPGVETDEWALRQQALSLLRTGDRTAIAAFLHDRERRTIAAYGLERFWRPTPFPFELG